MTNIPRNFGPKESYKIVRRPWWETPESWNGGRKAVDETIEETRSLAKEVMGPEVRLAEEKADDVRRHVERYKDELAGQTPRRDELLVRVAVMETLLQGWRMRPNGLAQLFETMPPAYRKELRLMSKEKMEKHVAKTFALLANEGYLVRARDNAPYRG